MFVKKNDVESFDFSGLKISDFTNGKVESGSFALIELNPNSSHQLAWSKRSDKFYFVISGKLNFRIEDRETMLSSGDFCLVQRGQKFSYRNDYDGICILALFHSPSFALDQEVFEAIEKK